MRYKKGCLTFISILATQMSMFSNTLDQEHLLCLRLLQRLYAAQSCNKLWCLHTCSALLPHVAAWTDFLTTRLTRQGKSLYTYSFNFPTQSPLKILNSYFDAKMLADMFLLFKIPWEVTSFSAVLSLNRLVRSLFGCRKATAYDLHCQQTYRISSSKTGD